MTKIIEMTIGKISKKVGKIADKKPVSVSIDFEALPAASQEFLIAYGVKQYIGDGAAGAETQAEFEAGIAERVEAVKEGTCGQRVNGVAKGPSNDPETIARKIAADLIAERVKATGSKLTPEQRKAVIEQYFTTNKDALLAEAAIQIAKRKAESEKAGASVDEMLAALLAPAPATEEAADETPTA